MFTRNLGLKLLALALAIALYHLLKTSDYNVVPDTNGKSLFN